MADPSGRQRRVARILSDINMLVLSGGQERINAGYCELLTVAGLKPGDISPVAFPLWVIEGL